MNILLIKHFFVGFMVSEIPRVSVLGYFPLCIFYRQFKNILFIICSIFEIMYAPNEDHHPIHEYS